MHLCGGEGLLTGTDSAEHQRRLKKKQKNRASAQRSRKRHTDKADALHQQHESLERHNCALRKEIQGLQAELVWWSRTLRTHECLCLMDCDSRSAPLSPGCWDRAERLLDPAPHRPRGCQERPRWLQTPGSSPPAQQLPPDLQPHGPPGLLLSPLPTLSTGPAMTPGPAQLSPDPVQSASHSACSLSRPSSKLNALLPSSSAPQTPQQLPGPEHPARGKLVSAPHGPLAALGLTCVQDMWHKLACSAVDQQGLGVDLGAPLLAFPLLSSAQVHL